MITHYKMISILAILLYAFAAQAGELKISETAINYGTIKEGPPVIKNIVLTNTGTSDLTIANVTAS